MYRFLTVPTALLGLGLAACSIEPTPREYIDRQLPAAEVRAQAEAMVRERIALLVQALRARDPEAARAALTPADDVMVIGPGDGDRFSGPAQIEAILERAATAGAADVGLRDVRVRVTPRANVAWFAAWLEVRRPDDETPATLRVSGVFVEREGSWELAQAHVSLPSDALSPVAPAPAPAAARAGAG